MEISYTIFNVNTGRQLASNAWKASTLWERMRGLLGRSLSREGGLILPGSQGVHTVGMKYPIDVVFLDRNSLIIYQIHAMKPGRISPVFFRSRHIIELPAGTLARTGTLTGHQMTLRAAKKA